MRKEVLRAEHLIKNFRDMPLLRNTSFTLYDSECTFFIGLSGTGLTALLQILSGQMQPDSGRILLDNQRPELTSPAKSNEYGIFTITENSRLLQNMTLGENIFLVRKKKNLAISMHRKRINQLTETLFQHLGIDLSPNKIAKDCSIFAQHMTLIAKFVSLGAKIILFGNVTSMYSDDELAKLGAILVMLRKEHIMPVIFSKHITSITSFADRIFVLRNHTISHVLQGNSINTQNLRYAMMRRHDMKKPERCQAGQEIILKLDEFIPSESTHHPISLSVRKGDIVGIVCMDETNGTLFGESLFGIGAYHGTIQILGHTYRFTSCRNAIDAGIGYIRNTDFEHLFPNLSPADNLTLLLHRYTHRRFGFFHRNMDQFVMNHIINIFELSADSFSAERYEDLSKLQRIQFSIARWLMINVRILVFVHPYGNMDENMRFELNRLILKTSELGISSIVITTLTSDIKGISDQILYIDT